MRATAGLCLSTFAVFPTLAAEKQPAIEKQVIGHIFRPAVVEATPENIARLKVPPGFKVTKFAGGLKEPRMLAVAENGDLYVTRRAPYSDVLLLRDADQDGLVDEPKPVAALPDVHGIALRDGKVYLAAVRKLYVADIKPDGTFTEPKVLYDDLPDAGQHPNRTLAFSPGGELFLSVGSTCNEAPEANQENATMLRVKPDGTGRNVFAQGLRNTIGFDWDPATGALWGLDHGIDWLGDQAQGEELNQIKEGKNYGWPFVYEAGVANVNRDPKPVVGDTWAQYAAKCENPAQLLPAHAAPMQFRFYHAAQFPKDYQGSAFATLHGSWNRERPSGYEVIRIPFKNGNPGPAQEFLTGFLIDHGQAQFGRPCGLAIDRNGSLLVSDDQNGNIYRVTYTGGSSTASR